jgi:hypothetical protein
MKKMNILSTVYGFVFRYFKKKKGCLAGKTEQQKIFFFKSLSRFGATDKVFFIEQYLDLLPSERREFEEWLRIDTKMKQTLLSCLDVIEKLMVKKPKS